MFRVLFALSGLLLLLPFGIASGQPCPDSSYCVVTFNNTYTEDWMPGAPYDYLTVSPNGRGETFADTGIDVRVYVRDCFGLPIVGITVEVFNSDLCIVPGGNLSDSPTDLDGCATFTGTLLVGGCAERLDAYAGGVLVGSLEDDAGTTVKINSPDVGNASCTFVDASDLGYFASVLGAPSGYDICVDFNESGPPTIDSSDLAFFSYCLGP